VNGNDYGHLTANNPSMERWQKSASRKRNGQQEIRPSRHDKACSAENTHSAQDWFSAENHHSAQNKTDQAAKNGPHPRKSKNKPPRSGLVQRRA
jgi:hypothetical protein